MRTLLAQLPTNGRLTLANTLSDLLELTRRATSAGGNRQLVETLRDLAEVATLTTGLQTGWTRRAPGFEGVQSLQTGDLVLVRAVAGQPVLTEVQEVSAGAARSPYSHVAVAWRDPATNQVYLVESREPMGVQISQASDEMLAEHARTLVLRVADPDARAEIANHVSSTLTEVKARLPIAYDSWLDDSNGSRFNCGQLAAHLLGPTFPAERTVLQPGMAAYAKRAGMPRTTMVLPGDFERDPRFATVAEAINPTLLKQVRPREAASMAIFASKNQGGDVLEPGVLGRTVESIASALQRLGILQPFNALVVGAAFDLRRDTLPIEHALENRQRATLKHEGRVPTRIELDAAARLLTR